MSDVDLRADGSGETRVLDVADYSDDGDPRVVWKNRTEALSQWVLSSPELPRQRRVDDGHRI